MAARRSVTLVILSLLLGPIIFPLIGQAPLGLAIAGKIIGARGM